MLEILVIFDLYQDQRFFLMIILLFLRVAMLKKKIIGNIYHSLTRFRVLLLSVQDISF